MPPLHRRRRRFRGGSSRSHLAAHQRSEPFLTRRIEIVAGLDQNRDVDQRQLVVLHQKRGRPIRELVLELSGHRRGEFAWRKFQFARMLDDRIGRYRQAAQRRKYEKAPHLPPPKLAARFRYRIRTFRFSGAKYLRATLRMSSAVTAASSFGSVLMVRQPR